MTIAPKVQRDYQLKSAVNDVIIHPNQGELISCDQNGAIKVWDLAENTCTHQLGNYYVWKTKNKGDLTDLEAIQHTKAHGKHIIKCLLSPDTKSLATCSADHTIKIWTTTDFQLDRTLTGHQRWVWDAAFSADSAYLVTGSSDHTARLWDLKTGETIRHYNGHQKAV
ncbi:TOR complex subunit lst8, partial [Irineochytrium annulatum]